MWEGGREAVPGKLPKPQIAQSDWRSVAGRGRVREVRAVESCQVTRLVVKKRKAQKDGGDTSSPQGPTARVGARVRIQAMWP